MWKFIIILIALNISATAFAAEDPQTSWSALAQEDLKFIKNTLTENHPGYVDPEDSAFKKWLEKGFEQATSKAKQIKNYDGLFFTIQEFINGFEDGHLSAPFTIKRDSYEWPGFAVGLRGQEVKIVETSDDSAFPIGTKVSSCDGDSIESQLDKKIFPYLGIKSIEATHALVIPYLFVDRSNPFVERLNSCVFEYPNGQKKSLALKWVDISKQDFDLKARKASFRSSGGDFSLRKFGKNAYWLSLPDFWPENEHLKKAKSVLDAFNSKINDIRASKVLVIDVRGNSGGSSHWGHKIAESLWGKKAIQDFDRQQEKKTYVEWRASAENLRHVERIVEEMKNKFGETPEIEALVSKVAAGLKKGVEAKQPYYREDNWTEAPTEIEKKPIKINTSIVFLTDGACFSACLDFADIVLSMPGVIHAGLPTMADTVYMEVRKVSLPSGLGDLRFPIKVYRGRQRKSNQAYIPSRKWNDDITDTAKLEKWILSGMK